MSKPLSAFPGDALYLDTTALYALLRGIEPTVQTLFARIETGELRAYTSVLTFDELAYRMLRADRASLRALGHDLPRIRELFRNWVSSRNAVSRLSRLPSRQEQTILLRAGRAPGGLPAAIVPPRRQRAGRRQCLRNDKEARACVAGSLA